MRKPQILALCLFWLLLALYPQSKFICAEKESVILIEKVTLIDGTGGPAVPKAFVLIKSNRIVKVEDDPIKVPKGARRISGKEKHLIPGLMDVHVHLRMINEAGGIVALGTYQTIGPAVHRELELLVGGGIFNSGRHPHRDHKHSYISGQGKRDWFDRGR